MVVRFFDYENKEKKERQWALDALSVLDTMSEYEEYNGTTESRIYDNWYNLKRELVKIISTEIKKDKKA